MFQAYYIIISRLTVTQQYITLQIKTLNLRGFQWYAHFTQYGQAELRSKPGLSDSKRWCFPSSLALVTPTLHFTEPTLLLKFIFQITIYPFNIRQKRIRISNTILSLVSQDFLYTGKAIWWNTYNFLFSLFLFSSGIFLFPHDQIPCILDATAQMLFLSHSLLQHLEIKAISSLNSSFTVFVHLQWKFPFIS